jgi:hypothetical protein
MDIYTYATATPALTRALSTPSPVMPSLIPTWRDRVVANGAAVRLSTNAVEAHHNSIASVQAPVPAGLTSAGTAAFGAAKQAAPPRGVPR